MNITLRWHLVSPTHYLIHKGLSFWYCAFFTWHQFWKLDYDLVMIEWINWEYIVSTSCYLSVLKNNLKEWWQGSPNIPTSADCVVKPWFSPQTSRQPIRWTAHTQMAMTVFCNCRIWLQKMKFNCISILITRQIL